MPDWQGRCDRCGAFFEKGRHGHEGLCGCCAVTEGIALLARRKPQKRVRVLRRILSMLLANRDSRPISMTDHAGDRKRDSSSRPTLVEAGNGGFVPDQYGAS